MGESGSGGSEEGSDKGGGSQSSRGNVSSWLCLFEWADTPINIYKLRIILMAKMMINHDKPSKCRDILPTDKPTYRQLVKSLQLGVHPWIGWGMLGVSGRQIRFHLRSDAGKHRLYCLDVVSWSPENV